MDEFLIWGRLPIVTNKGDFYDDDSGNLGEIRVLRFVAFERTHTIYVVFQSSRGFYNDPRVLIADSGLFQALAAILD